MLLRMCQCGGGRRRFMQDTGTLSGIYVYTQNPTVNWEKFFSGEAVQRLTSPVGWEMCWNLQPFGSVNAICEPHNYLESWIHQIRGQAALIIKFLITLVLRQLWTGFWLRPDHWKIPFSSCHRNDSPKKLVRFLSFWTTCQYQAGGNSRRSLSFSAPLVILSVYRWQWLWSARLSSSLTMSGKWRWGSRFWDPNLALVRFCEVCESSWAVRGMATGGSSGHDGQAERT